MDTTIVDRCGRESEIHLGEIREMLTECSYGLDVNPLELETHLETFNGRETITTSEIQKSLIYYSIAMCGPSKTDYSKLAARLLFRDVKHETEAKLGYDQYKDLYKFIVNMNAENKYSSTITECYSEEEINHLQGLIDPTRDDDFEYAGMNMLVNRYLIKRELPQTMFMVLAMLLAQNEKKGERLGYVAEFYKQFSTKVISLATPILSNLRKPEGNLSSCFITAMDDSLDSIFNVVSDISRISAMGGGVGINLSRVRCDGSYLGGTLGRAKGIIPWIKIINDTMVAVDQGGTRAGAATVSIDIWHRDLEKFLEMQTENGDLRVKCYDVFPQLVVPDLFMERVENGESWTLFDPHEILLKTGISLPEVWGDEFKEVYESLEKNEDITIRQVIDAKKTYVEILKRQVETGMPYIFFKDTVNRANPNKDSGYIGAGNLCIESYSNFTPSKAISEEIDLHSEETTQVRENGETHICNLVSINLAKLSYDRSEIEQVHSTAVRVLDNAIDITDTPVPDAEIHNNKYRVIGIGYMGLHDMLAKRSISYAVSSGFVDIKFEQFAYYTYKASILLAKERSTFGDYENSEYAKGKILCKTLDEICPDDTDRLVSREDWENLFSLLKVHGIRNSQCTAIAPNTSTSNLIGCTASVLPTFSKYFMEKNRQGSIPIFPPFIKDNLFGYVENKNIDQRKVVEVISNIQKWIDTGISMELLYNLSAGVDAVDIHETTFLAWKRGCKAIYYTRTVQNGIESKEKDECVSCAN